jgi:U3 small nucleolar ribonucleoprotein protein LCP5
MSSHGQDDGGVYRPPMIAPTAMEGEERSRDRRSKVRAEKEIQRRASRSAFIKELANEVEGRPEEVSLPHPDLIEL